MTSAWSTGRWCGSRGSPVRPAWPTSSGTPFSAPRVSGSPLFGKSGSRPPVPAAVVVAAVILLAAALVAAVHWFLIYAITVFPDELPGETLAWTLAAVVALLLWLMGLPRLWGRGSSRTKRWRPSAAATAAFLGVVLLSAVQINIYFGLNHTVSDLTGTAVARIQPLEAGLTRAAGGPAATGLAHWQAPAAPSRRRRPQGGHPRHRLRLPEPGRLRLPPAGLPEFTRVPRCRCWSSFPVSPGSAGRLADRRRAPEPAGPVRGAARRGGARGGGGRSQRLAVGKHSVPGQPDCPGGHLPGA